MYRMTKTCLLPLSVGLIMAADASWTTKPVSQWNAADAKQVLSSSPWVKKATVQLLPQHNESSRRDGGLMGGSQGTGLEGFSLTSAITGIGRSNQPRTHSRKTPALMVRWESAAPVRTAESKTEEVDTADWDGEYYALAVYNLPAATAQAADKSELKRTAVLKRDGKKDLKAARVDVVLFDDNTAAIVYLFPRDEEINKEDKNVELISQIGRLLVSESFHTAEMQLQGKLEL
jgi:hypothetical protein